MNNYVYCRVLPVCGTTLSRSYNLMVLHASDPYQLAIFSKHIARNGAVSIVKEKRQTKEGIYIIVSPRLHAPNRNPLTDRKMFMVPSNVYPRRFMRKTPTEIWNPGTWCSEWMATFNSPISAAWETASGTYRREKWACIRRPSIGATASASRLWVSNHPCISFQGHRVSVS